MSQENLTEEVKNNLKTGLLAVTEAVSIIPVTLMVKIVHFAIVLFIAAMILFSEKK